MAQIIIVILVICVAAAAAAYKLYRFFKPSGDIEGCGPEDCASCPYQKKTACSKKDSA
jgi:hypothetical protein